MLKGLKNTLAAAVMLGAGTIAANAADAAAPEVEAIAMPALTQNLAKSSLEMAPKAAYTVTPPVIGSPA